MQVPANTARRVIIDLRNYVCAYPEVVLSRGRNAMLRVHWQVALYEAPRHSVKGNRDEIEGKYFCMVWHLKEGYGDSFLTDGGLNRRFTSQWWRAGRYVELVVRTANEPLTIDSLTFLETRYPLEPESTFNADDARIAAITDIFEVFRLLRQPTAILQRLELWYSFVQNGLKTTIESPEPARSDCHAWGAHPVYHFDTSLLGIRPAEPGFRKVRIEPQIGHLTNVQATLVHPWGEISVHLSQKNNLVRGEVTLPNALTGTLVLNATRIPLHGGRQRVEATQ